MKKLCLILTILYCLTMFGCGKPADPQETSGNTTNTTGVADSTETTGSTDGKETTGETETTEATKATKPTDNSGSSAQTTKPTEHTCSFGNWVVKTKATCSKEGKEERSCSVCNKKESRPIAKTAHNLGDYKVCKTCSFIDFDPKAKVVELGIPTAQKYGVGNVANYVWDVRVWNGRVYRGAGDYDKNSGTAPIYAYEIESQSWKNSGTVSDQAVHRFLEIGGKLISPGIDPTDSWDLGNYYVLNDNGKGWTKVRTLPNGIHNYDMVEFDGKLFAGLGTEDYDDTVAVSSDGGKNWSFVPLYKDGQPFDTSGYKWTRTYDFATYNGQLYALIIFRLNFGQTSELFRYENGKMVWVGKGTGLIGGSATNRNYWIGEFELGGSCFLTAGYLCEVTDFADPNSWKNVKLPKNERAADAFLRDGVAYILAYNYNYTTKMYNVAIYKSATCKEGSFTEVVSFDYEVHPSSFDWDGTYFYLGMGGNTAKPDKSGMMLRVNPAA